MEKLKDSDLDVLEAQLAKSSELPKWLNAGENVGFGVQFPELILRGNHGDYWKRDDAILIMMMRRSIKAMIDEIRESRKGTI